MKLAAAALALSAIASSAAAQTVAFAPAQAPADGRVILPVGKGGALTGLAAQIDTTTGGAIARAALDAKFAGRPEETLLLREIGPFARVTLVGVGEGPRAAIDLETYGAAAARAAAQGAPGNTVIVTPDAPAIADDAAAVALGARLGAYAFGRWGAPPATAPAAQLTVLAADPAAARASYEAEQAAIAKGVIFARDLVSTPSNVKDPAYFVAEARKAFRGVANVSIEVLDEADMRRLGMGALLGVGQGSERPPRLIAVRYRGAGDAAPVALVGKGITFDSGGISIKPASGMAEMRGDMAGAAAALGAVLALAEARAPVNVVGIGAMAENLPDGGAIRPGDVLTSMSGKTIEVLNTDAEGRLVLADGLWFAQERYAPRAVVSIATLTGAVLIALGDDYGGLFTEDEALAARLEAAGAETGDIVWRLPVHESVKKDIEADLADLRNVVEGSLQPGASIGAAFLMNFAKPGMRYAHIDMAGKETAKAPHGTTPKGATGYGVRLLERLVRAEFAANANAP